MKSTQAITIKFLILVIALPNFSTATLCLFNQTEAVPRQLIISNQEGHSIIYLENATINIDIGKPREHTNGKFWILFYDITGITFSGTITYVRHRFRKYYDKWNITKVKGVRENLRKKKTAVCSISFLEDWEDELDEAPDDELAVIRLAQSCIRSLLCESEINEIDVDADVTFESIQSNLNGLVDFYLPKIPVMLNNFMNMTVPIRARDYYPELNEGINIYLNDLFLKDALLKQLPPIQRLRDLVISYDGDKLIASGTFRVADLHVDLDIEETFYHKVTHTIMNSSYITAKTTVQLDLSSNSCEVKVTSLDLIYPDDFRLEFDRKIVPQIDRIPIGDDLNVLNATVTIGQGYVDSLNENGHNFVKDIVVRQLGSVVTGHTYNCSKKLNEIRSKVPTIALLNGSE